MARGRPQIMERAPSAPTPTPDTPGSVSSETFPRRYPRLGSQYQTRIPKSTDPSPRLVPDLMSVDYPHVTLSDSKLESIEQHVPNVSEPGSGRRFARKLPQPPTQVVDFHQQSQRGGLLVHHATGISSSPAAGRQSTANESTSQLQYNFPQYCQPLLSSLGDPPPPHQTSVAWKQHMIQLHAVHNNQNAFSKPKRRGAQQQNKNNQQTNKRSRAKRKATASPKEPSKETPEAENKDTTLVWSLEKLFQEQMQGNRQYSHGNASVDEQPSHHQALCPLGEDGAHVLEGLQLQHGGNIKAAKLQLMVYLSAGRAAKRRKCAANRRKKEKIKLPAYSSSDSWRRIYEQMRFPSLLETVRPMATRPATDCESESGDDDDEKEEDCQNLPEIPPTYAYAVLRKDTAVDCDEPDDPNSMTEDRDDLKGAWRSILVCGKSLERQLELYTTSVASTKENNGNNENNCSAPTSNTSSNTRKPLLSTVVSFLSHAYGLPTPEKCFGVHHVMIEEVSGCLVKLLEHIDAAQVCQAKLKDWLFTESNSTGIDSAALQKLLDTESKALSVKLDEFEELIRFRSVVSEWEERLAKVLVTNNIPANGTTTNDDWCPLDGKCSNRDDLSAVEILAREAQSHGYDSKSLVQLRSQIQKACHLRDRIRTWTEGCRMGEKGTTKAVTALVRDANRLKLVFPEAVHLMEFSRRSESWVERANIAIRSRISLAEVRTLMETGKELPLDLSEYTDKLNFRVETSQNWLDRLISIVPRPELDHTQPKQDALHWAYAMRKALLERTYGVLHEIASEGSRIPVDIDAVTLLQVELDAKSWTAKAKKWIPTPGRETKKGKLEDLRDHVEKSSTLRNRLPVEEKIRDDWMLEGEEELAAIVDAADNWFDEYHPFLEGDNRKKDRSCLSIETLRKIAREGVAIHANIGNATSKVSRILTQAEGWYSAHFELLVRCKLKEANDKSPTSPVELAEMTRAVDLATSSVSLDLDEAMELKKLKEKTEKWFERASLAAPKRSKRPGKGVKAKFTVDDLVGLVEEASSLPVDTKDDVQRLQLQLGEVQTWCSYATKELKKISVGFQQYQANINMAYGLPREFNLDDKFTDEDDQDQSKDSASDCGSTKDTEDVIGDDAMEIDEGEKEENCNKKEDGSTEQVPMDQDETVSNPESAGDCSSTQDNIAFTNVHSLIKNLQEGSRVTGVVTKEGEQADLLESVSRWCIRSLKYLGSPREIFDRRFFGAFDRFLKQGQSLLDKSKTQRLPNTEKEDNAACQAWGLVLGDQMERLATLKQEREKFNQWCKEATKILADEKKFTLEKLNDIAEQSRSFPSVGDMVQKVRGLAVKATKWVAEARKVLDSDKKIGMPDARALLESGEKLNVNSPELRTLKAAVRATRGWVNRVKKCNLEQGSTNINTINDLIEEHDDFLIEMPDEIARLQSATQSYCICRRPYDGFMIGCDECDEWYHGPCIGVSESRADRFDKYVCIRCSVKNIFKSSATAGVGIMRKWTGLKDLRKARQIDYQKHQRKVRKENKDIEKCWKDIHSIEKQLGIDRKPESDAPMKPETMLSGSTDNGESISVPQAEEETPVEKVNCPPVDAVGSTTKTDAGEVVPALEKEAPMKNDLIVSEGVPIPHDQHALDCPPILDTVTQPVNANEDSETAPQVAENSEPAPNVDGSSTPLTQVGESSEPVPPMPEADDSPANATQTDAAATPVESSEAVPKADESCTVGVAQICESSDTAAKPDPCAKTEPQEEASSETAAELDQVSKPESEVVKSPEAAPTIVEPEVVELTDEKKAALLAKVEKAKSNIQLCATRLALLASTCKTRKLVEKNEDELSEVLRRWCIRVRSLVIVPTLKETSMEAMPPENGELSAPMIGVLEDAKKLGIHHLPDVELMTNVFRCMSWSLRTLSILKRKPFLEEMVNILDLADKLRLPDEKALRTMKLMLTRATQWQQKVKRVLCPKPGITKAIGKEMLRDLETGVEEIALRIPEVDVIKAVIKDKGSRHCFCGGPTNGGFMVRCGKCYRKFHGVCVDATEDSIGSEKEWTCVVCSGGDPPSYPDEYFLKWEGHSSSACEVRHDYSSSAPEPLKLWPPYDVYGSTAATGVLGFDCCKNKDEISPIDVESHGTGTEPVASVVAPEHVKEEKMDLPPPVTAPIGAQHNPSEPAIISASLASMATVLASATQGTKAEPVPEPASPAPQVYSEDTSQDDAAPVVPAVTDKETDLSGAKDSDMGYIEGEDRPTACQTDVDGEIGTAENTLAPPVFSISSLQNEMSTEMARPMIADDQAGPVVVVSALSAQTQAEGIENMEIEESPDCCLRDMDQLPANDSHNMDSQSVSVDEGRKEEISLINNDSHLVVTVERTTEEFDPTAVSGECLTESDKSGKQSKPEEMDIDEMPCTDATAASPNLVDNNTLEDNQRMNEDEKKIEEDGIQNTRPLTYSQPSDSQKVDLSCAQAMDTTGSSFTTVGEEKISQADKIHNDSLHPSTKKATPEILVASVQSLQDSTVSPLEKSMDANAALPVVAVSLKDTV